MNSKWTQMNSKQWNNEKNENNQKNVKWEQRK